MSNKYVGHMHSIITAAVSDAGNRCMFFDRDGKRCKQTAIQSHSLQKRGPLASIAEDGHVIKSGMSLAARPFEKRNFFEEQGIGRASTFLGFCEEHDQGVFSSIEKDNVTLDSQSAIIFSIRAISFELYRKFVLSEVMQKTAVEVLAMQDSEERLKTLKLILRGSNMAIQQNVKRLRALFRDFHRGPRMTFQYYQREVESDLPFTCTGAFEPEWDLRKNLLYKVDPMKTPWNAVSIFAGNIRGKYYLSLAGYQMYRDHRIDQFIDSVKKADEDIGSLLFSICAIHSENLFLKPSWFQSLTAEQKDVFKRMVHSGMFDGIRSPDVMDLRVPVATQTT